MKASWLTNWVVRLILIAVSFGAVGLPPGLTSGPGPWQPNEPGDGPGPMSSPTVLMSSRVYLPLIRQEMPRSRSQLFVGPIQAGSAIDADLADVAAADVDGDGDLDLIGVYPRGPELAVCYNDGVSGFSQPWYVNENAGTADLLQSVAAADIDEDGHIDLITATWNGFFGVSGDENSVAINRNRGDGKFERASLLPVSHPTIRVVVADLNRDGKMDIAATYKDVDALVVLLNQGHGRFDAYRDYPTGRELWSLAVADVNGDGYPDLIAIASSGDIVLLLNQRDGTFIASHLTLADGVQDIATGDFDEDGAEDLVALNSVTNTLTIMRNSGGGVFDPGQVITTAHWLNSVAVADLDGDRHLDLAVANYDSFTVSVYLGNGRGGFGDAAEHVIGWQPHDILTADMNRDGRPDVVAAADGHWMTVLLNTGNGEFWTTRSPYDIAGPRPETLEAADLNGDQKPDLVVYHESSESHPLLTTLLNDGHGRFSTQQEVVGYSAAMLWSTYAVEHPLATADFDGDGDVDVAFGSDWYTAVDYGIQFCILRNDGTGQLSDPSAPTDCARISGPSGSFLAVNMLKAADLDRDGDMDLVAAMSNSVVLLLNDGHGHFGNPRVILAQGSRVLQIADVNGDGLPDVVATDAETFNVQLLIVPNLGSGAFGQPVAFNAAWRRTYTGLAAGDLDGDADSDLVLVYEGGALVSQKGEVYLNDGTGRFSGGSPLSFPGQSPSGVVVADIDLDGDLDVLGTTAFNRTVTVNFNDADGRFDGSDPLQLSVITRPGALVAADFDGDSDVDVVTVGRYDIGNSLGAVTLRMNALRTPWGTK